MAILCLALQLSTAVAQQKTAQVTVHGKAVQLLPSSPVFVIGVGNVTSYFSTYNGSSGALLIDSSSGGVVSGELRPRSNSPGTYEGGYAQSTPVALVDYGSYAVSIPQTDADQNGIPDVLQFDRNGSFSATGSGFSAFVGTFSISINFIRLAGSASGTYSATTVNNLGQTNTVSGQYALGSFQGTLAYTRGSTNSMTLAVSSFIPGGTSLTGTTAFTLSGTDSLSYSAFTATGSNGSSYRVNAGSLTRSGDKYRGTLTLVDGLPQTYWADFTDYVIEATDPNDSNGNGIPDLTDIDSSFPSITSQPSSHAVTTGNPVSFSVTATGGTPLTYRWRRNGVLIAGASSSTYTITSAISASAGSYTVDVSNASGSITSEAANLIVTTPSGSNLLYALSVRSFAGSNENTLITGIVLSGSSSKSLVARAVGPGLAQQGVTGFMTDPQIRLFNGAGLQIDSNDDWGGTAALTNAFAAVGLAPLVSNSKDAALLITSNPGVYTAQLTSTSGSGIGLMELYDAGNSNDSTRMTALSVRGAVGSGANVLIVGFVISGSGAKQVVIRGLGPALAASGITGALTDPQLKLFNGTGVQIDLNDDWGGTTAMANAFASVGLGSLPANSKDSALVTTLATGVYTVQLSGVNSTTGVGLIEFYGLP